MAQLTIKRFKALMDNVQIRTFGIQLGYNASPRGTRD
jgi:hypothetical protein